MKVLALDPGTVHNAWAVVEESEGRLFVVEHGSFSASRGGRREVVGAVEALVIQAVERHGPDLLLVELPKGRKPSVPREVWRELQGIAHSLVSRLSSILPVCTAFASTPRGFHDPFQPPGWRQRLTGLNRPSDLDVRRSLEGLGLGPLPKNSHELDAVGLGVAYFHYPELFQWVEEPSSRDPGSRWDALTEELRRLWAA